MHYVISIYIKPHHITSRHTTNTNA